MDNSSCDKLEDRRDIFLRRGQMFLTASAERRNPLPAIYVLPPVEAYMNSDENPIQNLGV